MVLQKFDNKATEETRDVEAEQDKRLSASQKADCSEVMVSLTSVSVADRLALASFR